ncbi:THUMP domain-containing class I SAM-dependent RNA methyltransferase [Lachnoanaerobaculum saburreum]|uniref:THUMP domain-containing protein n=1 Tax=Lachnoanaerobaculum saburreum DSM 3986 TaxID=887325 RepID=E6LJ70_9FIRM|nr:class I SAM-dependent RNA methyltransferase [Lachnoanaerobaculum saburreum]EFU78004.1 hypothetical protein HMPREF0381_0005 [Lachnoanaerobaculum saburreum DSM 3986]
MKKIFELYAPCHFGLEAVLKKEVIDIGYDITKVEDGRVYFEGDDEAVARANMWLRTAERVLINIAQFKAISFSELFDRVADIPWEEYIPADGKFWVSKATSVKSKLFSPSDIQSIVKKAIVERLKRIYKKEWFEETGADYPLRVSINKDIVTIGLDTTGVSLHKRGYRTMTAKAPITETLAAALIMLTPWKKGRILVDPFCGSGTFVIEAAMIAANIAPGLRRGFLSGKWSNLIPKKVWDNTYEEAKEMVYIDTDTDIQGYDIDRNIVEAARSNAARAGVTDMLHLQCRDVSNLSHPKKYGFIITNPPYGERLEEKENLPAIYKSLGERYANLDSWSLYLITSYNDACKYIGKEPDKNRKIYNGMLQTRFYQYMGPRPPKKNK